MDATILKRAIMKLDSFLFDINELIEDDESQMTPDRIEELMTIREVSSTMLAKLINDIKRETGEEADFLNDLGIYDDLGIDGYPEPWSVGDDLLDTIIIGDD
jgi:hypothetical protein